MPMMLSAVNVALPSMAEALSMDAVMLSWVPMSYLMASAALVLSFGRLADLVGRKKIFLFGIAGLILSSILAATANDAMVLIIYRLIQGVAAAMLYATHVAIVSSVYPPNERGRMIGLSISIIYIGLTCGPLVGGWLTDIFSGRARTPAVLIGSARCFIPAQSSRSCLASLGCRPSRVWGLSW